ncbi:MAG: WYL domain-containing protein [Anaerolineaceae bacterium]|nr:WYL domain-containing protein [Anaerolineaceae bacterium]
MYNPTMRLLTILEVLQSRSEVSGHELAKKLEVEERSIRRYIMMLRDLGIPIEGERGRHGGYSLQKGFRLPPLMFNKEEITAVMLGLMLARELSVTSLPAIESAAAKIERVLPEELQQSADALRDSLILDNVQIGVSSVPNESITLFSRAVYEGKCLQITYISSDGTLTDRMIAPYGLVLHARTWYVAAYCYLRQDMRVFRLDRVRLISLAARTFTKPENFDAKGFILGSIIKGSGNYTFEVLFDAPISTVREVIPETMAILESSGSKTLMRCYSDDPYWLARYLVRIELPFTVLQSDELRDALRALANDILATIEQ